MDCYDKSFDIDDTVYKYNTEQEAEEIARDVIDLIIIPYLEIAGYVIKDISFELVRNPKKQGYKCLPKILLEEGERNGL